MTGMEDVYGVFVFGFGAIAGSFLNVCIYRMPKEKSVVTPRSFCPHCQRTILWYDNIPFFSYIILAGRCRFCKAAISPRYFGVELLTAGAFLILYGQYGWQGVLLPYCVFVCGLIVATFVDLEYKIIPDEISLGGIVAGVVLSGVVPQVHGFSPSEHGGMAYFFSAGKSLLGVLVGGGSIYLMGMIGDFIFKKETMGGGDVKLMGMVGAFLGWKAAILAFFIAPFFGAVFGIIVKLKTKESVIAYGPFLALGALISMFYKDQIIAWILGGYGLY